MTRAQVWIGLSILLLGCSLAASGQQSAASAAVPNLVNFNGVLTEVSGKPLTGIVGVTFYLYQDQQGGAPLWMETQNVQPDKVGHYSVMLGSTKSQGLPPELFASGEARWLGVQPQGQAEQPRVMLLSVPYAMKAGDAATVGGLPPSAFVLAPSASASANTNANNTAPPSQATGSTPVTTAGGTVNQLAKFDASADIANSIITDTGTKVGINTTAPASTLDVKGTATIRGALTTLGTLSLPATGAATSSSGKNSEPMTQSASSFNNGTGKAVNQLFLWQAEPTGNNTSTPSGTLNLLFGSGTNKPAETGLNIASNGQISFAAGQTFPGTGNGTITGITAGSDLSGGGTSGNVTLNLDTTKVPLLGTANTFTANQTVNGNLAATGSVSGATASFSSSSSSQILNVAQNGTGLGIYSSNVAPNVSAIYGTSSSATGFGVEGFNTASTGGTGVYAATNSTSGIALFAGAGASTGTSLGIQAQTNSPTGTALFAVNTAGGTAGNFAGSVKVGGNTSVSGNVSSTGQLISTVATGTAPLSVNSTTQVANLNASLLGGQPASAFATTGANNFSGNQTVNGNLSATGVVTGSSYQIGSNLFGYGSYANANAFLGFAGNTTMTGAANTASGWAALFTNTTGNANTADGIGALSSNTTGSQNTAVGDNALTSNTSGTSNAATGNWALQFNTTGSFNTAIGGFSGYSLDGSNITQSNNTFLGYNTALSTGTLSNATAIGANAEVDAGNSMVLGSINGVNFSAASTLVGIGTTAPSYLLHIGNQGGISYNNFLRVEGPASGSGNAISVGGHGDFAIDAPGVVAGRFVVKDNGIVAIGIANPLFNPFQIKQGLGHAIADGWDTYSSRRWKTNIHPLMDALTKVERLRGVSYDLKGSGKHEIGVIAEEVGQVVPEVVSYEQDGKDARGVDYSRLTALLIEAVKQQQKQIVAQQRLIRTLSHKVGVLESSLRSNRDQARSVLVSQAKTGSAAGQ